VAHRAEDSVCLDELEAGAEADVTGVWGWGSSTPSYARGTTPRVSLVFPLRGKLMDGAAL